ncbi:uncharacterized protein LOC128033757 [Gossypium raimondii]|uniref:uncharacterized protein LOC128033757 n=1 Tax=Gossypium raimondii TaxID=29730 RepID=UPI00227A05D1|nr:uncharacterized protein LOC128033757 [Gossypium raimondii]
MIEKSRTEEDHLRVLRKLFLRLRKFQLKLNPAKCIFGARSGKLLGFIVSKKWIEIDPDKVKAIRDFPPPGTQKEVRGFLGRLNYIARFISQLTEKYDPVFRLLKTHNPREWDEECHKTFDKIKQYLANAPILSPLSPDRPLILYLTVFNNSTGCVLGQHDETGKKERAIYYLSKKFTDCEMKYSSIEKLCCNGIGEVLVSPNRDHYPIASKLDFDCTNNMAEYEACIMGIRAAIERKIKVLKVYGDSALVIYQLKGDYLPREENQMADALATLASMIQVNRLEVMKPIQMSIYETPAHCYNIEGEGKYDHHWYRSILQYLKNREYPSQATENDKRTLRRIAIEYVLDGKVLYKKRKDQVLLTCVDAMEAKKILEEVYKVYGMEAVLPIEVEIPSLRKRMMRAYNKKVRPREFSGGDLVLKKILPMQKDFRGKWMPNWEGPYVVKKAFTGGALILSEIDGKDLPNPVNSDSVKKYFT